MAYWRSDEAANPDTEILSAARPSLATTGGMLACISSPYARRGELYSTWKRDFGANGDKAILVARAASRTMNPTLTENVIARAYERDAASAAAEYGAEFRTDVETFVSREAADAAVVPDRFELPPAQGVPYVAFVDPSGGSSDDMTLAIAHREREVMVLDCIRSVRPPFSPEAVVADFARTLRSYGVHKVTGDRYGGECPREAFRRAGIDYQCSENPKNDLYRELLPLLNGPRVELLDDTKLVAQLCALERRTARGGRDSIDHAPGAHDDVANAVAGALVLAVSEGNSFGVRFSNYLAEDGGPVPLPGYPDLVYCSLYVETRGPTAGRVALAFFAASKHLGQRLVLLDFDDAQSYSDSLLGEIYARSFELAQQCHARRHTLLAPENIGERFNHIAHEQANLRYCATRTLDLGGMRAIASDKLLQRDDLSAVVVGRVTSGGVKLSKLAFAKAQKSPLGSALALRLGQPDSPLA